MTVQEMHINIDLDAQKINSNSTRNILPEEKDWFLNNEVIKFLNQRTRDLSDKRRLGFEEDSKRLKDVLPLIRKLPIDVEYVNDKVGRFNLPSFVYKHIRTDCIFFKKCEASKFEPKVKGSRVYKFKLPDTTNRITVKIYINGVEQVIFDTNELPDDYVKSNSYFYLLKAFKNKAMKINDDSSNSYNIHYEEFNGERHQDFFFVTGGIDLTKVEITKYNVINISDSISTVGSGIATATNQDQFSAVGAYTGSAKGIVKPYTTNIPRENINIQTYRSEVEIKRTGRPLNEEVEGFMLSSHISKSVQESPSLSFERSVGYVYFPKNTIIKKVEFVYLCKPFLIDILLNQSLNLDSDICMEVCNKAASYIKALLNSDNYEKFVNENILIE